MSLGSNRRVGSTVLKSKLRYSGICSSSETQDSMIRHTLYVVEVHQGAQNKAYTAISHSHPRLADQMQHIHHHYTHMCM